MKKSTVVCILFGCFLLLSVSAAFATDSQETKQKITLRWADIPEAIGDLENSLWLKALKAKFPEVEFRLEPIMYSDIEEKFPLLMASGDMPDIFQTNAQIYMLQLVASNLIAPLDDVLAKYGKDIVGNMRDGYLKFGQYSGKQYAIPNSYSLEYTQMIRMDWLEKLGLKVPVTMEEFREVARAFTFQDPDGNGKQDTYGTAFCQNVNLIDSFFHAYRVAQGHDQIGMWRIRHGKQTNDWVQPEMKEALLNIASWYKEGLIDPESLTYDRNKWFNKYLQNKIGMWYDQPRRLAEMNRALKKAGVKNAKMWPIDPPKGPYGQGTTDEGQPWALFFANRNVNKAIEVLNYTYTQEFFLAAKGQNDYACPPKAKLGPNGWPVYYTFDEANNDPNFDARRKEVQYGKIGTGWSIENPNMTTTWPNRKLAKYVYQQFLNTLGPAQIVGNQLADIWALTSTKTVPVPADSKYFVNLQTAFREMCNKIVSGNDADQVWNDWITFYNANGGPEIEKQVNEFIPAK